MSADKNQFPEFYESRIVRQDISDAEWDIACYRAAMSPGATWGNTPFAHLGQRAPRPWEPTDYDREFLKRLGIAPR